MWQKTGENDWEALSLSLQPCAAVPPEHAESFSGAALCGDSHTNTEATPTPLPPFYILYMPHTLYMASCKASAAIQEWPRKLGLHLISIKGPDSTSGECENYVGQGLAGETHPICCVPSHKEPQQGAIHGTMQLE